MSPPVQNTRLQGLKTTCQTRDHQFRPFNCLVEEFLASEAQDLRSNTQLVGECQFVMSR